MKSVRFGFLPLLALIIPLLLVACQSSSADDHSSPGNARETASVTGATDADSTFEVATLAGGCFWCMEAAFDELRGVQKVQSGYSGGETLNPTYEQVSTGATGHAEAVQVTFDPKVISYRDLLYVLFTIHDPTTLNRQGADVGTQYRSAIFYNSPEQKKVADEVIAELTADHVWSDPVVTQVAPFGTFYAAESYHDQYYKRNSSQPYCQAVISPKIEKIRNKFADKLK